MIKLIQAACQWGKKDYDGWVIGKARYCIRNRAQPVAYESVPRKSIPGYVQLETVAYSAGGLPCQTLEICLVDTGDSGPAGHFKIPEAPRLSAKTGSSDTQTDGAPARAGLPPPLTMTFSSKGLQQFLSVSGDTNPIHLGPGAVIPGLWILGRLDEIYGRLSPARTLSIRFLSPVHTDDFVRLMQKGNRVTGTVGNITCFTMTIHTPDQTIKRR